MIQRPYQMKNIAGRRFGFLTAKEPVSSGKRGVLWRLSCDCGRAAHVVAGALLSGNTKSCGCRGGKHSPVGIPPIDRILANITMEPNSGCWIWMKSHNKKFYGTIGIGGGGKQKYVHRIAYEHFVGPIPAGMVLDHKCRVTLCCNPAHLRPMTIFENASLGDPNAWMRKRAHCPNGHTYTDETTARTPTGGRRCLTCAAEQRLRKNAKERALYAASRGKQSHQSPH